MKKLEFSGLDAVLTHFAESGERAQADIKTYRSQVKELTGHDPSQPVTPLDVVRIVQKVFFGGDHGAVAVDKPDPAGSNPGGCPGGTDAAPPSGHAVPPPPEPRAENIIDARLRKGRKTPPSRK